MIVNDYIVVLFKYTFPAYNTHFKNTIFYNHN